MQTTQIAPNLWTVEGPALIFAGAPMNTRMTVVRLRDGSLWVHSPIAWSEGLEAQLLQWGGEVSVLVAPNKYHYLFVEPWLEHCPQARLYVEPELAKKLRKKRHGLMQETWSERVEEMSNQAPPSYAQDVDQALFAGNPAFQEMVFFHRDSRTLILTDLMINLSLNNVPFLPGLFLRFEGVVAPRGGVPRLMRWFTFDKRTARSALEVIRSWQPERVLICHGEQFAEPGMTLVEREFSYLA